MELFLDVGIDVVGKGEEYASHSLVARSAARCGRVADAHARHLAAFVEQQVVEQQVNAN
jgi:hypothetical protein